MNSLKVLLIGLIFILIGCKKDKLVNEYAPLEGKWKLDRIERKNQFYINGNINHSYDTIFPSEADGTYEYEFLKKGKLKWIKNGEIVENFRIVFMESGVSDIPPFERRVRIRLDNKDNNYFTINYNSTEMRTRRAHIEGYETEKDQYGQTTATYLFIYKKI